MKTVLLAAFATALIAVSGCSRKQSAPPERIAMLRWSVGDASPQPAREGLAPSRARCSVALLSDGRRVLLVGGGVPVVLPVCLRMNFFDMPRMDIDFYDFWLPGDSPFVGVPSVVGGWIFVPLGWIIGAPVDLVKMPFVSGDAGDERWYVVYWCGAGFGLYGGLLVSLPFRILEWTFWDAPRAFGRFLSLHCRSYKSQVDWLIEQLKEAEMRGWDGESRAKDIQGKLEKLTGEKGIEYYERWNDWWFVHRDEFDSGMKRIKPPAPKPTTAP